MFQPLNRLFTPIRSVVVEAIPFTISLKNTSAKVRQLGLVDQLEIIKRSSYQEAAHDQNLLKFWPEIIDTDHTGRTTRYSPDSNQPVLIAAVPLRQPFTENASYSSIFAVTKDTHHDDVSLSRELTMTFDVKLKAPTLVGGIAFMGYPSLGADSILTAGLIYGIHYIEKI